MEGLHFWTSWLLCTTNFGQNQHQYPCSVPLFYPWPLYQCCQGSNPARPAVSHLLYRHVRHGKTAADHSPKNSQSNRMLAVHQLIRHLTPPARNMMTIPLQLQINSERHKPHRIPRTMLRRVARRTRHLRQLRLHQSQDHQLQWIMPNRMLSIGMHLLEISSYPWAQALPCHPYSGALQHV